MRTERRVLLFIFALLALAFTYGSQLKEVTQDIGIYAEQASTPTTPPANQNKLYFDNTGALKILDDTGAISDAGGNPFNQSLNTTDSPTFSTINASTQMTSGYYNVGTTGLVYDTGFDRLEIKTNNDPVADTDTITIITGLASSTNSGQLNLRTGNASSKSGDILLLPGTGATRGDIKFQDGSEGIIGHVWTSTGNLGEGTWAAPAAGGLTLFEEVDTAGPNGYLMQSPNEATVATQPVQFLSGDVTDAGALVTTGAAVLASGNNSGTGAAPSGQVIIASGATVGTSASGYVDIRSGSSPVGSGEVYLYSGNVTSSAGTTGQLYLFSGNTSLGSTGNVTLTSGYTNDTSAAYTSGTVNIKTGYSDGDGAVTGDINIETGQTAGDNANSGSITLKTGFAEFGTRGSIRLQDGSQGTAGHVWTSTGTDGTGSWQAPSGGGGSGYTYASTNTGTVIFSTSTNNIENKPSMTTSFTTNGTSNPVEIIVNGRISSSQTLSSGVEGDITTSCQLRVNRDAVFKIPMLTSFSGRSKSDGSFSIYAPNGTLFDTTFTPNTTHTYTFDLYNAAKSYATTVDICSLTAAPQNISVIIRQKN